MQNLRTKEKITKFDSFMSRDPQEGLEISWDRSHALGNFLSDPEFEDLNADYSTSCVLELT